MAKLTAEAANLAQVTAEPNSPDGEDFMELDLEQQREIERLELEGKIYAKIYETYLHIYKRGQHVGTGAGYWEQHSCACKTSHDTRICNKIECVLTGEITRHILIQSPLPTRRYLA